MQNEYGPSRGGGAGGAETEWIVIGRCLLVQARASCPRAWALPRRRISWTISTTKYLSRYLSLCTSVGT